MAKPNSMAEQPATEREPAPIQAPLAPRQMQVERDGDYSMPYTRRFPRVLGGICEFCGVMDRNQPSTYQYKLCPHYRGLQLRCTYCPQSKDADDVIYHADMNVAEHPDNPNKLVVWCNSYECSRAHERRFNRAVS